MDQPHVSVRFESATRMAMNESEQRRTEPARIRDMGSADIPAALQLCRASGWNQLESDWSLFLQLSPAGCRVAEKNGVVVGTVATVRYQDRFSWLSMVLVDPQQRRAGIGTQLVGEALNLLRDETCIRLDATPFGQRLYREHGFVDERPITRLTRAGSRIQAGPSARTVRRMRERDLPAVLDRDRVVFGADRGVILRSLFARSPEYAWIASTSDIEGYCFGRPGFLYAQLGPIVAAEESIARGLVLECFRFAGRRSFAIDAPQHHTPWIQWLQSNGFVEERSFVRMYRGENNNAGRIKCVFAAIGPEFG